MSETPANTGADRTDEIIAVFERIIDEGRRSPDDSDRARLAEYTPAEIIYACAVLVGQRDAGYVTLMEQLANPGGRAAELSRIIHADDPDPFAGLPDDAQVIFGLHLAWPWSPEHAQTARDHMTAWTAADRALFEERFGALLPDGTHWLP